MSIPNVVSRGYLPGVGTIPDVVRAGYVAGPVIPTIPPSIIRVFRVLDFANYAKVGEPIRIQGLSFSCV